ncbi:hypothetical protein FGO68_gene5436 [Halteria grandinella]|uniref:Uncharacterized protein n=1 Tax=Halteria grandinella TaxID=5974 RepID=A0A8J8NZK0_HALGN|nr:hypothetical protein FGO68_gene5436 [Halteria grandinella]
MDTTSLFDVSCDSNGTPIGMMGGGESHRSRKKSQRNTFGQNLSNQASAVVVAPGLLPSSRANSKTAREKISNAPRIEGEEQNIPIDKDSIKLPSTSNNGIDPLELSASTARQQKSILVDASNSKPVSARSNNLEIWLSKKKALDQQSQSRSSRRSKKGGIVSQRKKEAESGILDPLSESSEKDLSYLSKLQPSNTSATNINPRGEVGEEIKIELQQKKITRERSNDSQVNFLEPEPSKPIQDHQPPLAHVRVSSTNPIVAQRWSQDTESFLVFNPKDEAVRESQAFHHTNPLFLSQSQNNTNRMFKDALEHLHGENQNLKDQLREASDLIQLQRDMLLIVLKGAAQNAHEIQGKSGDIVNKLKDQGSFLKSNSTLDTSDISFMIDDHSPTVKDKERQEFIERQTQMAREIDSLKQELQQALAQAAINQSSYASSAPVLGESQRRSASPALEQPAPKEEQDDGALDRALQPLFDQLVDASNEVYIQDQRGRIMKIVLVSEQADLDEMQQNMENEGMYPNGINSSADFQRFNSPLMNNYDPDQLQPDQNFPDPQHIQQFPLLDTPSNPFSPQGINQEIMFNQQKPIQQQENVPPYIVVEEEPPNAIEQQQPNEYEYYDEEEENANNEGEATQNQDYDFRDFMDDRSTQQKQLLNIGQGSGAKIVNVSGLSINSQQ